MPGIENRPSARVTAWYLVPEGSCVATTTAPGTGCFCGSRTTPSMAPVVTPCAWAAPGAPHNATSASRAIVERTLNFISALLNLFRRIRPGSRRAPASLLDRGERSRFGIEVRTIPGGRTLTRDANRLHERDSCRTGCDHDDGGCYFAATLRVNQELISWRPRPSAGYDRRA